MCLPRLELLVCCGGSTCLIFEDLDLFLGTEEGEKLLPRLFLTASSFQFVHSLSTSVEFQRQSLVFRIISIIKTMSPCLLFENDANVCPEVCAVLVRCHLAGAGAISLISFYTLER